MQQVMRNNLWRKSLFVAYVAGLLGAFYAYTLLRVRPELFYQQKPDIFLCDWSFCSQFLGQLGGPLDYVSAFLSVLFVDRWFGAIIVTALVALICLATRRFIASVTGSGGEVLFLVPAVLIMLVLGQYRHPVNLCLSVLVSIVSANAYVCFTNRQPIVRFAVFAVVSLIAYYLTAGLYVLFALLCGLFEFQVRRHRLLGTMYVFCAGAIPMTAGTWLFDVMSLQDAYRGLLLPTSHYWLALPQSPVTALAAQATLFLFFPLVAFVLAWRRRSDSSSASNESLTTGTNPTSDNEGNPSLLATARRLTIRAIVFVVAGIAVDAVSFDYATHCLLRLIYDASRKNWQDAVANGRRIPSTSLVGAEVRTVYHVNRALYFSGGLLDRMFTYRQFANTPTLTLRFDTDEMSVTRASLECCDILFDLGRVNESEHMAYEVMEILGERPRILKRLVYISVLKGQPEAARRFLAHMERSLLHRVWARQCLQQLDADPLLSNVPEVASRRALILLRDRERPPDVEVTFQQLLERNRRNQMAFEYLMAHYLLTRQVQKVAANLHRLDDFDYPNLPQHLEEALVIYLGTTGAPAPDLAKYNIRPKTRERYAKFVEALKRSKGNALAAFVALHPDFGDTYFFFHAFGHNDLQLMLSRQSP